jgi:uncharacterized protein (TIGR02996 family)
MASAKRSAAAIAKAMMVAAPAASKASKAAKATKTTAAKTTAAKPTAAKSSDGVAALEAAFAKNDGEAALLAALAWWREQRAPALADLIDAISERVSAAPIMDDTAWHKVVAAKDPRDLGALLPGVTGLAVSYLPTAAEYLSKFPDDPRLAAAIGRWAIDPPTTSTSGYPFWVKMLATVERLGDTRVVAAFAERRKLPMEPSKAFRRATKPSKFWPKFYAALEKASGKLAGRAAAIDAKPLERLRKQISRLSPVGPRAAAVTAAAAPKAPGTALRDVLAHLAADRVQAAIDAMLDAWRANRVPALADTIDRATRLLPTYDLPFATSEKLVHGPWTAAFERDPIAAMPQLLQNILPGGAKLSELRLAQLATLPDDPRLALRLAELSAFREPSPQRTQYWKALFELILRIQDVRTCAPIVAQFRNFTGTYYDHHGQAKKILGTFAQRPEGFFPRWPPALSADELELLAKIDDKLDALLAKHPSRTLVAAIADNWDDDGPKSVYADWLQERGHPRGELIVRALEQPRAAADPVRDKALWGTPYLHGVFEDVQGTSSWERTHPSVGSCLQRNLHVQTWAGTLTWRALADFPLLAIVETIAFQATILQEPTPEDIARVLAAARSLASLDSVPYHTIYTEDENGLAVKLAPLAAKLGFAMERTTNGEIETARFVRGRRQR